ncbi:isopentenyl-diphosphate delta-isomerase [Micrococcales bacterium KH10]|nr:isopentenyl-diphosphate delta-isomerase [Micrococcales bacterium KH10]
MSRQVGAVRSEQVVLLSEDATAIGAADRVTVHHSNTPLHLAFSCYLFNQHGQLLLTRRALSKLTWPGVWTNSFCGHPQPSEDPIDAIHRRAEYELGAQVTDIAPVLPDFRYMAIDASGIVENEVCPVFSATIQGPLQPRAEEVSQWQWVDPVAITRAVRLTPFAFSPWMVEQLNLFDPSSLRHDATSLRSNSTVMGTP